MNIEIVVAAHKRYQMPADSVYLPVQAGAAGRESIGYVRDDEHDNISAKNETFCELTCLYWAWRNLKDADAIGLVHYRRHFKGKTGIASRSEIEALLATAPCILPTRRNYFIETTYSQYAHAHHAIDLDTTREILSERHPDYLSAFDETMKSTKGHRFNMLVMKRPLFDDYCGWLFGILFELEKRLDISSYSPYDRRVFGFVAERLLDVYIRTKGTAFAELPVLHSESQHWPSKIIRFLKRKFLPR